MFNVWQKNKTNNNNFQIYSECIYFYISIDIYQLFSLRSSVSVERIMERTAPYNMDPNNLCHSVSVLLLFPRLSPSRLQRRQLFLAGSAYLFTPPSVKSMRPTRTRFPPVASLCSSLLLHCSREHLRVSREQLSVHFSHITFPKCNNVSCVHKRVGLSG